MSFWLMKSEPETYSIEDLSKQPQRTDFWDGIRNYQARNMMRDEMKVGDLAFFYHSNCKVPGIVGVMEVVKSAYPDSTAWDSSSAYFDAKSSPENPRWVRVDVKLKEIFPKIIPLSALRENVSLKSMVLLRPGNRLSITPVSEAEWNAILSMKE